MKLKLTPLAICLAFGLTAVAGSAQAGWFSDRTNKKNKDKDDAVTLPAETPGNPAAASKGYPNGRPWQAVNYDFMDVKRRIGEVKDDTEEIIRRLRVVDEDLESLKGGQVRILQGIGRLEEGQEDLGEAIDEIADAVSAQGNVLEVQVRVGDISEPDDVSIDSSTVILYVQVIQNGAGVTGLPADAFSYTSVTPAADAASYCGMAGIDGCFKEPVGSNGLYILNLDATGGAGHYSATVAVGVEGDDVSIDSDDSNGASIVTFEIEEPILVPDPA